MDQTIKDLEAIQDYIQQLKATVGKLHDEAIAKGEKGHIFVAQIAVAVAYVYGGTREALMTDLRDKDLTLVDNAEEVLAGAYRQGSEEMTAIIAGERNKDE